MLVIEFPGFIIPALPEKQILGTFKQQFIESRKRGLQKFLTRVAGNKSLVEAQNFVQFLTSTEREFGNLRIAHEQEKNDSMSTQFTSFWDKAYFTVFDTFTGVKPIEMVKVVPDTKIAEIESISQYAEKLDDYVKKLMNTATHKISMDKEVAQSSIGFGNSFLRLSGKEHGLAAASFGQIGQRACDAGDIGEQLASSEDEMFLEPIKEFHLYILSMRETLKRRESMRKAYEDAVKTLNNTAARPDEQFKPESPKQAAVEECRAEVEKTLSAFESMTEVFLEDFKNFKKETSGDVVRALFHFVRLQADFHKRCGTSWNEYQENQYVAVPVSGADTCVIS